MAGQSPRVCSGPRRLVRICLAGKRFHVNRGVRVEAEAAAAEPDFVEPGDPIGPPIGPAIEHLVLSLPPKERASIVLRDVEGFSTEAVAEILQSSATTVRSQISSGRRKIRDYCRRSLRASGRGK